MIHTILVEDDLFTQNYFVEMLSSDERIHFVTAVRDAFEAEKLCTKETDLVLMDVQTLHRHSGLAAGKRIKEKFPGIKIVIMTSLVDPGINSPMLYPWHELCGNREEVSYEQRRRQLEYA